MITVKVVEVTAGCMFGDTEPGEFNIATFQNPTVSDVYTYVTWWLRNENSDAGLLSDVTFPKTTHVTRHD